MHALLLLSLLGQFVDQQAAITIDLRSENPDSVTTPFVDAGVVNAQTLNAAALDAGRITTPLANVGSLDAGFGRFAGGAEIDDGSVLEFPGAGDITIGTSGGLWSLQRAGSTQLRYNPGVDWQFSGKVDPSASATYDLGTAALKWQDLYISDTVVQNGRRTPNAAPNDGGTTNVYIEYGRDVMSSGTKTVIFKNAFSVAPACFCQDGTALAACDVPIATISTTQAVVNGTTADQFSWQCIGDR